jgi:NADPH:quinone reductase-like Zn-dependent oxidoreductase
MRAVVITKHGDPSVLQVQQRPDPPPKLPAVAGYEVAGTVEAVGGTTAGGRASAPMI